ncbi:hypothetical protein D3C71_2091640 [compost metagenome]
MVHGDAIDLFKTHLDYQGTSLTSQSVKVLLDENKVAFVSSCTELTILLGFQPSVVAAGAHGRNCTQIARHTI